MVKRLRLRPLTPTTRVRFPHESPKCVKGKKLNIYKLIVGVDDAEGPPVPIPNTEVKLSSAEDTWLVTARENRKMPTFIYSSIAQSVVMMYRISTEITIAENGMEKPFFKEMVDNPP